MSRVVPAVCPVPGHHCLGLRVDLCCLTRGRSPPLPAPCRPQQGTKVAAGTPSFHVLLTPILMKSCGFWLRLAESVFAPW